MKKASGDRAVQFAMQAGPQTELKLHTFKHKVKNTNPMLMKKNQDVQVKKKWKLFLEPLYVGQDVKQEGAIFTWDLNS